jgi:predicted  nucleic acid-binding Zn-ribbon protein
LPCREGEQEKLINYIQDANQQLNSQNEEYTELRAELGVMESRNYQEKREIERLEADLRDATAYSQKCYGDI